jgi:hypothetical protein
MLTKLKAHYQSESADSVVVKFDKLLDLLAIISILRDDNRVKINTDLSKFEHHFDSIHRHEDA